MIKDDLKNIFVFKMLMSLMLILVIFVPTNLKALEVESFADGSCWLSEEIHQTPDIRNENKGLIKFVSFNDNTSVTFTRDEIFQWAMENEELKRSFKTNMNQELNFHCGSYGHSVIVIDRGQDQCVWMYFKDGNWLIRSRGVIAPHESSSKSCHGLKTGSLLLSVNNSKDKDAIKNELIKNFSDELESIVEISGKVLKLVLKDKYRGSEKAIREKLMNNHFVGSRVVVEFNFLNHPVGEFKE